MNVLVVGDDEGVFMFNPKTKMELVKFNVQAKAACIIGDEIICSHKEKPILYSYKIHRSIQTPRKIIMPGIVDSLCSASQGPYFYGSIQNTLYCWDIRTGRCLSTNQAHYQSIKFIKTSKDFTITGSNDGQIAIYRSFAMAQVHDTLQPIIVINAHSLPVTDLEIKDDFCFTSSTDFSIKVWNLAKLRLCGKMEKIQQGNLLMATIEYPEAIISISSDNMNLNLLGLGKSGTVYRSNIGIDTANNITSSWNIEEKPERISFNPDGNEIVTSSDRQINIFDADSQTNLRNIFINKKCTFFFSILDSWKISKKGFGQTKNKNSQIAKLSHLPSNDDFSLSLPSRKEVSCPLLMGALDFEGGNEVIIKEEGSNEDLKKEIERLKKQNQNLYSQLVQNTLS